MIQLYLCAEELPSLLTSLSEQMPGNPEALQWQLAVQTINGQSIAFAQDLKTDYWFCFRLGENLTAEGFEKLFLQQLTEHALRVCNLTEEETGVLAYWVAVALEPLEIYKLEPKSAFRRFKKQVAFIAGLLADDYPMPDSSLGWFQLSLPFNRKIKLGQSSLETFQNFWLGLLQYMRHRHPSLPQPRPSSTKTLSNVIPFKPRSQ